MVYLVIIVITRYLILKPPYTIIYLFVVLSDKDYMKAIIYGHIKLQINKRGHGCKRCQHKYYLALSFAFHPS